MHTVDTTPHLESEQDKGNQDLGIQENQGLVRNYFHPGRRDGGSRGQHIPGQQNWKYNLEAVYKKKLEQTLLLDEAQVLQSLQEDVSYFP